MKKIMFLCLSAMVFGLVACEKERQKAQVYDEKWYSAENYPLGKPQYLDRIRMKCKTAAFDNQYVGLIFYLNKSEKGYKNSGRAEICRVGEDGGFAWVTDCKFVCNDVAVKFIKFNYPPDDNPLYEIMKKQLDELGAPKENTDYLINWDKIQNIITINGAEFEYIPFPGDYSGSIPY